jgi:hypothetical protein
MESNQIKRLETNIILNINCLNNYLNKLFINYPNEIVKYINLLYVIHDNISINIYCYDIDTIPDIIFSQKIQFSLTQTIPELKWFLANIYLSTYNHVRLWVKMKDKFHQTRFNETINDIYGLMDTKGTLLNYGFYNDCSILIERKIMNANQTFHKI